MIMSQLFNQMHTFPQELHLKRVHVLSENLIYNRTKGLLTHKQCQRTRCSFSLVALSCMDGTAFLLFWTLLYFLLDHPKTIKF